MNEYELTMQKNGFVDRPDCSREYGRAFPEVESRTLAVAPSQRTLHLKAQKRSPYIIAPELVRRRSPRERLEEFELRYGLRPATQRSKTEVETRKKSPRERLALLERRYGLTPSGVVPFSAAEVEMFKDSVIAKPHDFDGRLVEFYKRKDREMKLEAASLRRRWAALKRARYLDHSYIAAQPEE